MKKEETIKKIISEPENILNRLEKASDPFSEILKIVGKNEEDIIPWKYPKNKNQLSQNAEAKIQLICEVLNEKEELKYTNRNKYKYRPYFIREASGWVLSSSTHCLSYYSSGGSGIDYKTKKLALFAGKIFLNIYLDYLPE